jgi:uncharacterized protein (DUF4415 family)
VREFQSGERIVRYTREEIDKLGPGQTDWARVDALTDEEIEAAMRDDPDWADAMDVDWSKAVLVSPRKKKALSVRLDEDVINFFKGQGRGYQTRMNAVLRHFMEHAKKSDAAE